MIGASTANHYEATWPDKPAPCLICNLRTTCATNDVACIDFYRYVQLDDSWPDTKVRTPTPEYYNRIYRISGYERNRTKLSINSKASGSNAAVDPANSDTPGL